MKNNSPVFLDGYASIGFTENPFTVHALRPDEMGERLLIGRDEQIELVMRRLHKHGKITCLDGHVGVGKTSLVNVAAYKCFQQFLNGTTTQLLIPTEESFQLKKDEDVNGFCAMVFRKVAHTLLAQRSTLANYEFNGSNLNHVNAWLNSPVIQHITGSGGIAATIGIPSVFNATAKLNATENNQLNTSAGFNESGFEELIKTWLKEIFSIKGNGGVVCVIDNLEILESGAAARRTLEALRDKLFNIDGLRWVFCGANGVVNSLAASPRLGAFLNTPIIEVQNMSPAYIEELIKARLVEFSTDPITAEKDLPIRISDIKYLYQILNFNLRDLLACADSFCDHQFELNNISTTDEQKKKRFDKWLEKNTNESYSNLASRISQDTWALLDIAMSDVFKGTFGVGDYETFNANSKIVIKKDTYIRRLRDLIKLGIMTKSIDDDNDDGFKRDIYTVTAKGAMVHYARLQKDESKSLASISWLRTVNM